MTNAGMLKIVQKLDQEREISCFERLSYALWVRNEFAGPVMLDELVLAFESGYPVTEEERSLHCQCPGVILEPGATKCVRVGIIPTLLFRANSNVFGATATICIQGQDGPGPRQTLKAVGTDHIVVRRGEVLNDEQVFVSFRDPEDLALAEVARDMLALAGYRPYLAREDHGTGAVYWEDKIYLAIRRSVGTLVIWSAAAAANPTQVLRELKYSREVGVPVGLFRERCAELPEEYPRGSREYAAFHRETPWVPFAQALRAAAERRAREEPFFLG